MSEVYGAVNKMRIKICTLATFVQTQKKNLEKAII